MLAPVAGTVNQYYWYIFDEDFGPFFLKFGSYFPYNAKVCLNGHEWLKRQLAKAGIQYEALDDGLLRCSDPKRAQALADSLSAAKIDALARKWFKALPHPFPAADRRADFRYEPFIWQGEFSLTQVPDRPLSGRVFFEEVIRENLDLGRPDQVALIFAKWVTRAPWVGPQSGPIERRPSHLRPAAAAPARAHPAHGWHPLLPAHQAGHPNRGLLDASIQPFVASRSGTVG